MPDPVEQVTFEPTQAIALLCFRSAGMIVAKKVRSNHRGSRRIRLRWSSRVGPGAGSLRCQLQIQSIPSPRCRQEAGSYSPALFRETAERIRRARLRLYPGKGHAPIATLTYKPAVEEILGFLTANKSTPATQP